MSEYLNVRLLKEVHPSIERLGEHLCKELGVRNLSKGEIVEHALKIALNLYDAELVQEP